MPLSELKLNENIANAVADNNKPVEKDETDRSDMLFSYMNMIAFNNKVDLKLN